MRKLPDRFSSKAAKRNFLILLPLALGIISLEIYSFPTILKIGSPGSSWKYVSGKIIVVSVNDSLTTLKPGDTIITDDDLLLSSHGNIPWKPHSEQMRVYRAGETHAVDVIR